IRSVRPSGEVGALVLPSGSTASLGTGASVIRSFASSRFDAVAVGDPDIAQGRGRVSIYLGSSSFNSAPSLTIEGQSKGDLFGATVADLGDINGDGLGDMIIGAPGKASGAGAAYVYLGGSSPSTSPATSLNGGASGDLFGSSAAGLGDMNSDGFR